MSDQGEKPGRPVRPPRSKEVTVEQFESWYKEAYKKIDNGITLVTEGRSETASEILEEGLKLIDKALSVKVETFEIGADKLQLYIEMQNKMRITKKEVLLHFTDNQLPSSSSSENSNQHLGDAPPSYEEYLNSLSGEPGSATVQYPSLDPNNLQLDDMCYPLQARNGNTASPMVTPVMSPQNGEMIFQIENGVQIFFIYANGRVTSPSYPSFLSIFTFPEPICSNEQSGWPGARGFLQVGEWSYPLVPSQSPVLHSFYGAYMFPDAANPEPGASVGILIPDTVSKDELEMFEQILSQMTSYQEQKVPSGVDAEEERAKVAKSSGQRIAEGLVSGAEAVSKGVVWGAEKLSNLISYGSDKLKDSLEPEAQHRPVDPKWQKTAEVARSVSGTAVKVSGYLLSQVGKATMALGKRVAPAIQKHGTRAISRLTGYKESDADASVGSVMEVASGAVVGASTIYMSLENAAAMLAMSLSDNTVKVVTHKYGPEYGSLTGNTLYAVGQTAMVGHNISSLGVKGIAKRTAKDTGKALIGQYKSSKKEEDPDGTGEVEVMDGVEEGKEVLEDSSKSLDKK
ncbi:UNVERIFIED_CONTAM: hypothetical protein RMT77_015623 [Armadillidium vulgare]